MAAYASCRCSRGRGWRSASFGDAASLGMVCGGDVTVRFQHLPAGDARIIAVLRDLMEASAGNLDTWLVLNVQEETAAMMDYSIRRLTEEGYMPYYLYRQTRMAGNLENTGWAKPGEVCRYNIYTMDECASVIACGAGGVTKLRDPYSDRLERIFNFKYPTEYISRHGEILERKDGVTRLYEQFRQRLH